MPGRKNFRQNPVALATHFPNEYYEMESPDRLKLFQLAMGEEEEDSVRSSRSGVWDPPSEAALEKAIPGFHIEKLIAIGGMAAVYRAKDAESRQVAIKLMPSEFESDPLLSTRFESEMKILSGLKHEHIVQVSSTGTTPDGLRYIAMEYLPGGTLRGKRELAEALQIMQQICEGLEHSHSHGVIHRDLKPSNILLSDDGSVKIADFGLAKKTQTQSEAPSLTLTGAQLGTPHYMAPEMLAEESSSDVRTDIYSLGVIFYQLLTGKLPVGRYEKASRSASVPKSTDKLLARAMSVDPDKRFQTVGEMREALERLSRVREIAKQRRQVAFVVVAVLGVAGTLLYRKITVPPNDPIIHARGQKLPTHLPWQSELLWRDSPFENVEWARARDFSAGPGTRMNATISTPGRQVYFRGRNLFLRPGSELQLQGSAGKIRAEPLVLDGGRIALIDDREPSNPSSRFNSNSRKTGAVVIGAIRVDSASQIIRSGPGIGPNLRSSLSGSAPLMIGHAETLDTFVFSGDNRDFSGDWLIEGLVRIDSSTGLGTGSVVIRTGSLRLPPLQGPTRDEEPAETGPIFVSSIGQLAIFRDTSFQSLTIDGEEIAPGEYDEQSDFAKRPGISISATLVIRETAGEAPRHFLPNPGLQRSELEKAPTFLAQSDGEWNDSRIWKPRIPVRGRYSGSQWIANPNLFLVPAGRTLEVGWVSPGLNYFDGRACTLEEGSFLSFTEPGSILTFPKLHLDGGTIRYRLDPGSALLSATLAGDLQVNRTTSFDFGIEIPDSPPNRLFVLGRLSGKDDIALDGHSRAFLVIGADTSDYSGNWVVQKGGLGALEENTFKDATVRLLSGESQLGAYRLPVLRVKRVESQEGAEVSPVRGTVWIDEWIHAGEPVAPGIYQDHPAMYRSEKSKGNQGRIVVGYETDWGR